MVSHLETCCISGVAKKRSYAPNFTKQIKYVCIKTNPPIMVKTIAIARFPPEKLLKKQVSAAIKLKANTVITENIIIISIKFSM